jgi:hypothetical protein
MEAQPPRRYPLARSALLLCAAAVHVKS